VTAIVNVVGIYEACTLRTFSWDSFDRNLRLNLRAPIELILAWLDSNPPSGSKIVNVSSAAALVGSRDLGYAASKAALSNATRSLARSLAPRGIAVFCVSPGIVDTAMSRAMPSDRFDEHVAATLLGRPASCLEVAEVIFFLITGNTEYLSGSDLEVTNGLTW
jgi:3-oxoacyl-[acyl-carrier protein] reductase